MVHANVSMTVLSLPLKLNATAEPHNTAKKTAEAKLVVITVDFILTLTSLRRKKNHKPAKLSATSQKILNEKKKDVTGSRRIWKT